MERWWNWSRHSDKLAAPWFMVSNDRCTWLTIVLVRLVMQAVKRTLVCQFRWHWVYIFGGSETFFLSLIPPFFLYSLFCYQYQAKGCLFLLILILILAAKISIKVAPIAQPVTCAWSLSAGQFMHSCVLSSIRQYCINVPSCLKPACIVTCNNLLWNILCSFGFLEPVPEPTANLVQSG